MSVHAETSSVIELRQYQIVAGQRERMIAVFDGKLIEGQEQVGMRVLGQFRDLDDPDRFTWVREFSSMESRQRALTDFYSGPVWKEHRGEANPLLEDNDNVLLLKPVSPDRALKVSSVAQRPKLHDSSPGSLYVVTIYYLWKDPAEGFTAFFNERLTPELAAAGLTVLSAYVTETTPNDFPRLPVRQHEKVFVWFTKVADASAFETARGNLNARLAGNALGRQFARYQERQSQVLRLTPTSRSLMR